MENEISTSLIEYISEPGFQTSLIATYNCYFPFYEEVILRRLVAGGCAHNILMVDANCCAEAFANGELRPRRAGRDYTLIPVKVGGAFHPKIILRFGKTKGALFVGSHNLTLAGFGLNDEITNTFRAEGSSLRMGGSPFRLVFDHLARFVPSELPDLVEAYEGLKHGVPWIENSESGGDPNRIFLTSAESDLWSQIVPLLPKDVSTAFICGPFFDSKLTFIRQLLSDVRPRELVIGIDPTSVEIDPKEAKKLAGVRFVNIAGIPKIAHRREKSAHYLHAKILWFTNKKKEILITGSANPSSAAFLALPSVRNFEAVVADRRTGASDGIDVDALIAASPITTEDWTVVTQRRALKTVRNRESRHRVCIATPTSQGFLVQEPLPEGLVLYGVDDNGLDLGKAVISKTANNEIAAPETVRDSAYILETRDSSEHLLVIVHRTVEISKYLGGDTRKALRQVLGALEEDPCQLETLLKITQKVIFDTEDVVHISPLRSAREAESMDEAAVGLPSLALNATGRQVSQRGRSLANGDIVILLDALIHRLGEGLPAVASPRPRNDEDEIGADDEDGGELAREVPDFKKMARACRSRTRHLIKCMKGQLDLAAKQDLARRVVVQLAAVLCVVRALRNIEQRFEWRREQLELINYADEWDLFEVAVLAVTWGTNPLASRALSETNGETFEELSTMISLLGWLAWDLEIDVATSPQRNADQSDEDGRWHDAQFLASLGSWLIKDENAMKSLRESITKTSKLRKNEEAWLSNHAKLARYYAKVSAEPDSHGQMGRMPNPGDLVILSKRFDPRIRVVLNVYNSIVVVYDPAKEAKQLKFMASRISSLPWLHND